MEALGILVFQVPDFTVPYGMLWSRNTPPGLGNLMRRGTGKCHPEIPVCYWIMEQEPCPLEGWGLRWDPCPVSRHYPVGMGLGFPSLAAGWGGLRTPSPLNKPSAWSRWDWCQHRGQALGTRGEQDLDGFSPHPEGFSLAGGCGEVRKPSRTRVLMEAAPGSTEEVAQAKLLVDLEQEKRLLLVTSVWALGCLFPPSLLQRSEFNHLGL